MLATTLPIIAVIVAAAGWIAAARARSALDLEQRAHLRTQCEAHTLEDRAEHWESTAITLLAHLKRMDSDAHDRACQKNSAELVAYQLRRLARTT